MTATTASGIASISISQRVAVGLAALLLGFLFVGTIGFAQDMRLHNGGHDYRHSMGFPCH